MCFYFLISILFWILLINFISTYFFQQKRDASGAAIAIFTANHHSPTNVTHKTTLQGVVYQLDVALQSSDTQKAGLVFIYDMSGSKYSNFDYDLSQKILTLLKVSFWWFWYFFIFLLCFVTLSNFSLALLWLQLHRH